MLLFPIYPLPSFEEFPHQRKEISYIVSILGVKNQKEDGF
jgi:hypothetical protein